MTIRVAEPIRERTWLILDRLGTEKPDFIANPKIDPRSGPDQTISSQDILYGARTSPRPSSGQNPSSRLRSTPSATRCRSAPMYRGTWKIRGDSGVPFLFHHHLARLWEGAFWLPRHSRGAWRAGGLAEKWHLDNLGDFLRQATANDLLIIDLWGGSPAAWKANMKKLIATAKTKTDQIIVMTVNSGPEVIGKSADINRVLQELVAEKGRRGRHHEVFPVPRGAVRLGRPGQRVASDLYAAPHDGRDDAPC